MLTCEGLRRLAILGAVVLSPWGVAAAEPMMPAQPLPQAEPPKGAPQALEVFPASVNLDGPRAFQRLGVVGRYADGRQWDLSREAKIVSSNAAIVRVDGQGVVHAAGDGQATLTIQAGGQSATVPVTVRQAQAEIAVDFTREVIPVLTKAGCNQGACHGAQHGRGGFRLSLLGFDPEFDYFQIVQSAEGRRIVVSDPERSILISKPALVMEHAGGERFQTTSPEYQLLKQWLADGVPEPKVTDPQVTRLEVWPPRRVMVPGERQQLVARATWSDGRVEDVTWTAQFDTLNDATAEVSSQGLVTAKERGETHIMVRFGGMATVMQVTSPYTYMCNSPPLPTNNFIDDQLNAKWRDLGLIPSELCSDEEFFRRIHLDTIGTLPAPADVLAFLADPDPNKRAKAIDRVLDRPEFVDYWAYKWGDLLRINRSQLQEKGMWSFHNWVRAAMRDNRPIDAFVRDIITAEGSTFTEGPANFYRIANSAPDWSENTTQIFLGVRLQCAKCHHHPFEKWSQDDYYGMSAFFVRLGTKNSQEFGLFGRETVVYLRPIGEQTHPRKGGVVKPHPLGGADMDDEFDRRRLLAEWMTAPDNPYFARNMVNRFWGYYMGRGLVEPLDDMRETNPPSIPLLLDALAADFVEHKFDFKHLLRVIMNSRAYQLSSRGTPGNEMDASNVYYTRYTVKRLSAEQMADALDFATGTREKYPGLPLGTRAIQLPDTQVRSFLLDVFGRPPRKITCECERSTQPNIAQALHLLNGDFINQKIEAGTGRIAQLVQAKKPLPEIIDELYLVTLSRPPRAEERTAALAGIAAAPTPREGVQDLLWALLNSREFQFNH
ncbi:MAG: DUF1553 domain-containing protein [Gemmataceae bacterium]